ncbi:MAG: TetR/AcrR family transcriptional regulator [Proteobacteria bacterium]|nr:TetR/AcrR family transcriptional regulator [Pseudomonadota bacterium]
MARPTKADAQATRRRLLLAATAAFSRRGLQGTTLRSVAQEAGVTMPTIHHYFGSKQGLFDACRKQAVQELASELVPLGTFMGTVRDQVVTEASTELPLLVERLVREGSRAARSHRMALQLVWRPLVDDGWLDPVWTKTVLEPFLGQITSALAEPLGRSPVSLRLDVQGVVALTLRYALSTPEHLAQLAGLPAPASPADGERTVTALDDHLVSLAQRLLGVRND